MKFLLIVETDHRGNIRKIIDWISYLKLVKNVRIFEKMGVKEPCECNTCLEERGEIVEQFP